MSESFLPDVLTAPGGAAVLRDFHATGRLAETFPELDRLFTVEQSAKYHPEGNVLEHSFQALEWAQTATGHLPAHDQLVVRLAALTHDIGKFEFTQHRADGRITSHGHAKGGALLLANVLPRHGFTPEVVDPVTAIVACHMDVHGTTLAPTPRMKMRLAKRLAPATPYWWALVCEADSRGRGTASTRSRAWDWIDCNPQ